MSEVMVPCKPIPHGTYNGYGNYRCRCDSCTEAAMDQLRKYNEAPCPRCGEPMWGRYRPESLCRSCRYEARRKPFEHGTERSYIRGRCRCDECRRAATEARTRRRRTGTVTKHNANGYANGCRCEICRRAAVDRIWLWRAGRRKNDSPT